MEWEVEHEIPKEKKPKNYPSWMILVFLLIIGIPVLMVFFTFLLIFYS
jgi:hypothetical protein